MRDRYSRSGDNTKMKAFTFARNEEELTDNSRTPTGTKIYFRSPSPSQNSLVLKFHSLPYPTGTIRRRVRTYIRAQSITWQPNEKRLTIIYEYGALSQVRFARAGAPLLIVTSSFVYSLTILSSIGFKLSLIFLYFCWLLLRISPFSFFVLAFARSLLK